MGSGGGARAVLEEGMKESASGLLDGAGCSWRRGEAAVLLRWGCGAAEQRGRGDVVALRGGARWARLDLGLRQHWNGRCGAGGCGGAI